MDTPASGEYYRRDQKSGISPPDLAKDCTFAEHIVHARGKRTRFTSVSLDLTRIRDLGDADYRLEREMTAGDGHLVVEHDALLSELRKVSRETSKDERLRAVQALRDEAQGRPGTVVLRHIRGRPKGSDYLGREKGSSVLYSFVDRWTNYSVAETAYTTAARA